MKWTLRRSSADAGDAPAADKSISQRAKRGWSPGRTAAFFAVFLVTGLGFLMIFAVPAWKVAAAQGWTPVECEIVSSSVGRHSSDGSTTYSIEVSYRYRFEGAEYLGDRYEFLGGSSSGFESKKKVVDALPASTTTTCYVDPDEPSEAVLYRGLSWVYLFAFLPLIFIAVGGLGMAWALVSGRVQAKRDVAGDYGAFGEPAGAFREVELETMNAVPTATAGPVELEEPLGPMGKLGCLIGICLLWNGIVSIFVWKLWSAWRAGGGIDGCMAIFLIPFVLVGLAILVGIPYQLLALANPRPRLVLSRGGVPLGGSAQLDWGFRGSTGRLRNLRIWVVGVEKATYRHGTTTHTDTEVFAEIEVVRVEGDRPLDGGSATVEIPADTMHSFDAPNNKIVWTLKLTGEIAWWPDVIAEFPFIVEPGRGPRT